MSGYTPKLTVPRERDPRRPTIGYVRAMQRPPSYAELHEWLAKAEARGATQLVWQYRHDGLNGYRKTAQRCECGAMARNHSVCEMCVAMAPLVINAEKEPQLCLEVAERAFTRLGAIVEMLDARVRAP